MSDMVELDLQALIYEPPDIVAGINLRSFARIVLEFNQSHLFFFFFFAFPSFQVSIQSDGFCDGVCICIYCCAFFLNILFPS